MDALLNPAFSDTNSNHCRYLDLIVGLFLFRLIIYLAETWNQASFESSIKNIKDYIFPPKPKHLGQIEFPSEAVLSYHRSKTRRNELPSYQLQALLRKVTELTDGRVKRLRECDLTSFFEQVIFNKNTGKFETKWDGYQGVYYEVAQEEAFELVDGIHIKMEESERIRETEED